MFNIPAVLIKHFEDWRWAENIEMLVDKWVKLI